MSKQWDGDIPIEGCSGCQTAAGRWGCPAHSPNAYVREDEIILELAFKDGEFSGIIVNNQLIEDGEVVEYVKKSQEEIGRLKEDMKRMVKFIVMDATNMDWTSTH